MRSAAFCDALLDLEPFLEGSSGEIISPQSGPLTITSGPSGGSDGIRLSLVIPTYCEATNIKPLLEQLIELLEPRLRGAYELIVVDDDSPDRTWEVAAALRYPQVRVVRRQGERGLASAVVRGWQVARGDILAVMDADLQHPPEANWGLYQEMMRGADLAGATRNVGGGGVSDWSIQRRVVSRAAQLLGLLLLPEVFGRVSDPMSGFFMVRRSAIAGVSLSPIGYKILMEVVARGRVRWIGEVPYEFRERVEGETKLTYRICLEYLLHLLRLRWSLSSASSTIRYGIVGVFTLIVDTAILYCLSDPGQLGWSLSLAKLIGAQPVLVLAFWIHEHWTFARTARPADQVLQRALAFTAVSWLGLGATLMILLPLVHWASLNPYWANAIAILVVSKMTHWLNRHITWAEVSAPPDLQLTELGPLDSERAKRLRQARGSEFPPPGGEGF